MPAYRVESSRPVRSRDSAVFLSLACFRYMKATAPSVSALTTTAPMTHGLPNLASPAVSAAKSIDDRATVAFLRAPPGRRLISIMVSEGEDAPMVRNSLSGSCDLPEREPDREHHHRPDIICDERFESAVTHLQVCHRVREERSNANALAQLVVETGNACAPAAGIDLLQLRAAAALLEECDGPFHADGNLFDASLEHRIDVGRLVEPLQERLRLFDAETPLTHQILTQSARSDGDVASQDRPTFVAHVDRRALLSNFQQPHVP